MALFLFTKAIIENRPIRVFNHGKMQRDFTYIDDIVEGIVRVMVKPPAPNPQWDGSAPDPGSSYTNYKIYNIGNNNPVRLSRFIEEIEKAVGKEAVKELVDMQPGDVPATYADIDDLAHDVGFAPKTPLHDGIRKFVDWYKDYYNID